MTRRGSQAPVIPDKKNTAFYTVIFSALRETSFSAGFFMGSRFVGPCFTRGIPKDIE